MSSNECRSAVLVQEVGRDKEAGQSSSFEARGMLKTPGPSGTMMAKVSKPSETSEIEERVWRAGDIAEAA